MRKTSKSEGRDLHCKFRLAWMRRGTGHFSLLIRRDFFPPSALSLENPLDRRSTQAKRRDEHHPRRANLVCHPWTSSGSGGQSDARREIQAQARHGRIVCNCCRRSSYRLQSFENKGFPDGGGVVSSVEHGVSTGRAVIVELCIGYCIGRHLFHAVLPSGTMCCTDGGCGSCSFGLMPSSFAMAMIASSELCPSYQDWRLSMVLSQVENHAPESRNGYLAR